MNTDLHTGYVTFRFGDRVFATPLTHVREVVRLTGLTELPGMTPPLAGVLMLRGTPLPVLDIREPGTERGRGDVVVFVDDDGAAVGVAVDAVEAVLDADLLTEVTSGGAARGLPDYVTEIRQGPDGPVLLVDLRRLVAVGVPV